MTKTEQLNQLFEKWENETPDYQGKFIKDGINNENLYLNAKTKILFLTKEPNNPKQEAGDFREWWKEGLKYTFSHRLAEWSYGILNNFPEFESMWYDKEGYKNAIFHVAFMNVKKIGGVGQSNYSEMEKHLIRNKEWLLKQIEIIEPQVIITGLTWGRLRNILFDTVEWKSSGYNITIGRYNESKIIDFYHPSARNAAAASYSLLGNVISSKRFQEL
ncbi:MULTISPECIES: hypothetical protein [Flagellimonas]|uniref:Uracil-DNA glycosylase n=1 Tax=Flagellimonas pelagia TaxID=2306998 RepID=A0A3A1NHX2_9FLAO|nr:MULTISPECIES: hypothetical protein [Allomuricauda]RIV44672.1 hypothetical protein D2V05_10000 [Allomuricauda maritima]TXJ94735.1 hypothetical protein FQ017_09890 [Allomuricauda maritima]